MKFKGIIFDFNGVLWWDSPLVEESWNRFAMKIRGKPFYPNEIEKQVHGRNNKHTLSYLFGRDVSGQELDDLTQQKESGYRELCLQEGENFKLSPGATILLDFLVKQDFPHTIATASEKTNLDFFVKHLELNKWFDLEKIVYDDGTFPGKPAPDIYLKAAKHLNLEPHECMVVEDSHSGIEAAFAAGIGHIIALGPKDDHGKLNEIGGVSRVIICLEEILLDSTFFETETIL